jgi:hypothetical protein
MSDAINVIVDVMREALPYLGIVSIMFLLALNSGD